MHGLTRVRSFCQDDAQIFCTHETMQREIRDFMTLTSRIYAQLGMPNFKVVLRLGQKNAWVAMKFGINQMRP